MSVARSLVSSARQLVLDLLVGKKLELRRMQSAIRQNASLLTIRPQVLRREERVERQHSLARVQRKDSKAVLHK